MEALDLTLAPPRSAFVPLGGVLMLARTIDKVRATLPGGNLGVYQIPGFSERLFTTLGIDHAAFTTCVAEAASDEDVVAWVFARSTVEARETYNAQEAGKCIADRLNVPDFFDRYPVARTLSPQTTLLELLDHDDAAMFA